MKRLAWFAVGLVVLAVGCKSAESDSSSTSGPASGGTTGDSTVAKVAFATAQPVFAKCAGCHSGPGAKEGLDLTSYASIMKGGNDGAVIVPGDPDASILVNALKGNGRKQMPPTGRLADDEIQKVVDWVKAGATE